MAEQLPTRRLYWLIPIFQKRHSAPKWARLIQKVYHTDPLLCSKCNGSMRIISFIEDEDTIKKILLRLDLWMPGNHDPPNLYKEHQYIPASKPSGPSDDTTHDDYVLQMPYEDEYSQLTPYEDCI